MKMRINKTLQLPDGRTIQTISSTWSQKLVQVRNQKLETLEIFRLEFKGIKWI